MTQARQEQLAKQDAERQRREQAAKIRDELEMMRKKLPILEAENARLTEECGIWKNAQTAASALHEEMEKLRAAHTRMKGELHAQQSENAKLKRAIEHKNEEMKRSKSLQQSADKQRNNPSTVPTRRASLGDGKALGACMTEAQRQIVCAHIVQRAFRRRKLRAAIAKAQAAHAAKRGHTTSTTGTKPQAQQADGDEEGKSKEKKYITVAEVKARGPELKRGQSQLSRSQDEQCNKFAASGNAFTLGFNNLQVRVCLHACSRLSLHPHTTHPLSLPCPLHNHRTILTVWSSTSAPLPLTYGMR